MTTWTFRIHGPRGMLERTTEALAERSEVHRPQTRGRAADIPISDIMTRQVVCAFGDLRLPALLEVMLRERLGCVPVVDEDSQPLGMVTKLDLVEHMAGPNRNKDSLVADVMMPLAITLDYQATIAHAAALMAAEDLHHVMIVSGRKLVGLVSTMDVTRWLAKNDESAS